MEVTYLFKTMIVIGLDQSLSNTGWIVLLVTPKSIKLIDYGTFKTKIIKKQSSKHCLNYRLIEIKNFIEELILKYSPDLICTEYVFKGIELIKLEGILHVLFVENKILFSVVSSSRTISGGWRKELNIKTSNKSETFTLFKEVNNNLDEHSYDSLAIALVGLLNNNYINKTQINEFIKPTTN